MEALKLYRLGFCRQCGQPLEVCRDQTAFVSVDRDVCVFTRALDAERRNDLAKHENIKLKPGQPHPNAGMIYLPRLATPEEIEQARRPRRIQRRLRPPE